MIYYKKAVKSEKLYPNSYIFSDKLYGIYIKKLTTGNQKVGIKMEYTAYVGDCIEEESFSIEEAPIFALYKEKYISLSLEEAEDLYPEYLI